MPDSFLDKLKALITTEETPPEPPAPETFTAEQVASAVEAARTKAAEDAKAAAAPTTFTLEQRDKMVADALAADTAAAATAVAEAATAAAKVGPEPRPNSAGGTAGRPRPQRCHRAA